MMAWRNGVAQIRSSIAARLFLMFGLWCLIVFLGAYAGTRFLYKYYQTELFYAQMAKNLKRLHLAHMVQLDADSHARPAAPIGSFLSLQVLYDIPYSGWYWQIRGTDGSLMRSRSLWDCEIIDTFLDCGPAGQRVAERDDDEAANADTRTVTEGNLESVGPYTIYRMKDNREKAKGKHRELRIGVTDYLPAEGRKEDRKDEVSYQYIVAGDYVGLESLASPFGSSILLLLVFGTLVSFFIGIRFGLSPFHHIQRALRRLQAGGGEPLAATFPREVMMVVTEFDKLIRNSNMAQIENLAHHLRTPLAIITNEARIHPGPLADTVDRQTRAIQDSLNHYLDRARRLSTDAFIERRFSVASALKKIHAKFTPLARQRQITLTLSLPDDLLFRGNRGDMEDIVEELLGNAVKWARREIVVSAEMLGRNLVITVHDDGPGIPEDQRERVFERGVRLNPDVPGTGIGLDNANRIAQFAGGAITLKAGRPEGLRAILTLPSVGED